MAKKVLKKGGVRQTSSKELPVFKIQSGEITAINFTDKPIFGKYICSSAPQQ